MKKLCLVFTTLVVLISFANAQITVNAKKRIGTLTIDGTPNETDWNLSTSVAKTIIGSPNNTVQFGVLWDALNLYVGINVIDATKKNESQNTWDDDAIEVFIDAENNGGSYGTNDRQFIKGWKDNGIWEKNNRTTGVVHAWAQTASGYSIELQIPWSNFGISNPASGLIIGFDVACDDDDNGGARDSQVMWAGDANNSTSTTNFGDLLLTELDTQAPTAPGNLNATNITTTSLTLNWNASTDNIGVTGYDVYQNNVKINGAQVTGTSYDVTGLASGTTYSYYVVAKDLAGNSGISSSINATTLSVPDIIPPSAPTNLNATNITLTSLTLNWTASTDNVGVTGYDVYQDNVKINGAQIAGTNFNVTGLTQSTTYSFYVVAFDAATNSTASSAINATTLTPDTDPPTAPSNLGATNITSTTLTLNWTASTDNTGVSGYDVYKDNVKINGALVAGTTYNVSGLTASTSYNFFVTAKDAAGNTSANSNTINVTTQASTGCVGTGAINFQKWNNVGGAAVSDLTSISGYPNNPDQTGTLTSFEIPTNSGNRYGTRVYGYICPPATGLYTFWIASDDNSQLWLSINSSPANKVLIASVASSTNSREWNKFITQKSLPITLIAGQLYYVEALMKEDKNNDNMAVGWAKPGQSILAPSEVVPGTNLLVTIPDTQAPTIPINLSAVNILQASFILKWAASTDNVGVIGYDVYKNGVLTGANITGTSFTVPGLATNTVYTMTVKAKDAAGNQSLSLPVIVTTLDLNPALESFTMRTIIANQRMPHDLVYGPDNKIWYTERFAGKVSFVDPVSGSKTVVLSLGSQMVNVGGQDGLMGLVLHPQFMTGKPYAYISYTYQSVSSTVRKTRIERYTYNFNTLTLGNPVTVLQDIPGSNDHNSARLAIGPDLKLYYSVGDMGAGQFDNLTRPNNAQNTSIYEGKILRLNTEPDGVGSWIPTDNPYGNAVYTLGHRNPQGLVWGNVNGVDRLYSSEHGPFSDDEINVIEAGRNYGWPLVAGYCDGNYNGRNPGGPTIISEQDNCATLNVREPLRSLFPATDPPTGGDNLTWPSVAPSGTDFYGSNGIPGWQNSLLVAELKRGAVGRLKLSSDGLSIISDTIQYFQDLGRFRDVVASPDGLKIYVACDSSGATSGPTGNVTTTPANPGSILEFTYSAPGGINRAITQTKEQDDLHDKSIDVYPNPASNYFIIYNYKEAEGRSIALYDLNGKRLRYNVVTNLATRIETHNLSNGMYILKVYDKAGKAIRTEKIFINK